MKKKVKARLSSDLEYNQFQQTNLINSSFEFSQCQEDDNCVAFIMIESKLAEEKAVAKEFSKVQERQALRENKKC